MLVDIPADDLLARLKAGKVYVPEQVERAARNFFRKGNLMALRELALRRTADRVEDDVQAYRSDQAIERVWKTEASLLCCVGPRAGGDYLVRSAARLATQLGVEWTAVYVETPALQRLPAPERERILTTLKLAQDLGAKTAILSGEDPAALIVDYARTHNCSKVLTGRGAPRRWAWRPGMAQRIADVAPDLDLIEIGRGEAAAAARARPAARWTMTTTTAARRQAAALRVGHRRPARITTLVATALLPYFDLANIVMLFLLTVVLVGIRFGRGPAVLAAFVSVAAFDFFCVPPRLSFAVSDAQYLLTFAVMLAVALIIGQMTAGPALPGACRVLSRGARALPLRVRARPVRPAARPSRWSTSPPGVIAQTFRRAGGGAGSRRAGAARRAQRRRGAARRGPRRRAVGLRQRAARGPRHRHARRQRIALPAAAGADAHARRARDQAGAPADAAGPGAASASSTPSPRSPRSRSSGCTTSKSRSRR